MSTHQDTRNFIQICISNALQDARELESNKTNTLLMGDNTSEESDDCEQNSLLNYYLGNDDNLNRNSATEDYQDISTSATPQFSGKKKNDFQGNSSNRSFTKFSEFYFGIMSKRVQWPRAMRQLRYVQLRSQLARIGLLIT